MTEKDIQLQLYGIQFEKGHRIFIPNSYSLHWKYECDLLSFTQSEYLYEYEIKLTYGDYKADLYKEMKHERYAAGQAHSKWNYRKKKDWIVTPNNFYYVMPEEIYEQITEDEKLDYAGYMVVTSHKFIREKEKPPRLHTEKASSSQIKSMLEKMVYKYWDLYKIAYERT